MVSDTPETDAQVTTFSSISKLKKRFECSTGKVSAEFARKMERRHKKLLEQIAASAAVYDKEDLRDGSRWSIFNEGRASALYAILEDAKCE